MDQLFQTAESKKYFNNDLPITLIIIGFIGVLSLIPFYIKSKKFGGFLAIILIGLGISGISFWLWINNIDSYYFIVFIFVIRPFVFLMTFMGAGALIEIIEVNIEQSRNKIISLLPIISRIIIFAGLPYVLIYSVMNIADYIELVKRNENSYTFISDIYITTVGQIVVIALVEIYTFLSQHENKIFIMVSMIPPLIITILYFILGLVYKNILENILNRIPTNKDPLDYLAAMCYCFFIAYGLIPAGFIPVHLKIPNDE